MLFQSQGIINKITANGMSNIVALSSIQRSLGHSEPTHINPIKGASQSGVERKCHEIAHIIAMNIDPIANTFLESRFFLLNSPKNGSPNDNEIISGNTNSGLFGKVRNVIPIANAPHARALTCFDS